MPLIITNGMGTNGPGTISTLVVTSGYGGVGTSPCAAFRVTGLDAMDDTLIIHLNSTFSASGPAIRANGYSVTLMGAGNHVEVLGVEIDSSGQRIILTTTIHTYGATYTLHMPEIGLISFDAKPFSGAFEINYLGGSGSPVALQLVRSLDARIMEVLFNRRVNQSDAENIANYSVSPALTLFSSTKVTDFHYRLKTSQQVIDLTYDVTISGIRGG